jgi:hypothetical protein
VLVIALPVPANGWIESPAFRGKSADHIICELPAIDRPVIIWFPVEAEPPLGTRWTVTAIVAVPVLFKTICFRTAVLPTGTVYTADALVLRKAGPASLLAVNTATVVLSDKSNKRIAY